MADQGLKWASPGGFIAGALVGNVFHAPTAVGLETIFSGCEFTLLSAAGICVTGLAMSARSAWRKHLLAPFKAQYETQLALALANGASPEQAPELARSRTLEVLAPQLNDLPQETREKFLGGLAAYLA